MKFIGMDFSITSPFITCIDNTDMVKICGFTQEKSKKRNKTIIKGIDKIYSFEIKYIERNENKNLFYINLSDTIFKTIDSLIKSNGEDFHVACEDYASSANGKIITLGECMGTIKYLYNNKYGKLIIPISIPTGKMIGNADLKGNVGKYTNIEYFLKNKCNFLDDLKLRLIDICPIADIVDSYNIAKTIELAYKVQKEKFTDLPKKLIKSYEKIQI